MNAKWLAPAVLTAALAAAPAMAQQQAGQGAFQKTRAGSGIR